MATPETQRKGTTSKRVPPKKTTCELLPEGCLQVLDEDGVPLSKEPALKKDLLVKMHQNMIMTRALDERGMMLQRQGRIGFYVPSFGQEAIQTGTVAPLDHEDWIFPSYREPGVFLYRGADLHALFCNLFGNAEDESKGRQMPNHYSFAKLRLFSVSSPISTQVIQAVGAAMASKLRKEKQIAISYFGDGGTSENDFHTGLTFAGAYKAPAIFICTNNQYAISLPVSKQTGAKRLADKAIGYGMPGQLVDGNDILAVYQATAEAVARARQGDGPSMLECLTLRMGPHSSSDDPTRYRDESLYNLWKDRDPIQRFGKYLVKKGYWSESEEKGYAEWAKNEAAEAAQLAEKVEPPSLDSLFEDVYAELTPQLKRQRAALNEERELRGKFVNTSEAFPL